MRSSGSRIALRITLGIVLGVAFPWVATAVPMGPISAADSATVVPLLDELAAAGPLAVSANGQTAYVVDESRRAIVGFDPFDPTRRRDAIGPAADTEPMLIAVAGLPGDMLAVVERAGDAWSLGTYRVRPGDAARAAEPLQRLAIGRATAADVRVGVAVSRARDWFAVAGLPEGLPPVVRAVFAGAGVRPLSDAGCPPGMNGARPVAIAVSPADEVVLFEATTPAGPATLAYHGPGGRELLRLDTGLADVRGATFSRGDGTLWVITGAAADADRQPDGLWRLDAVMRRRRQAVQPVLVARLTDPRFLVGVSERSLVVVHGGERRQVVRVDPHPTTTERAERAEPPEPPRHEEDSEP